MNIRPALQKDYEKIAELIINELGYKNLKPKDVCKRLEIIEKSHIHQTFVACIDDHVVGFIGLCKTVTYETDEQITILAFAVSEKYQCQGIGKALLASAKDYAEGNNVKIMRVSSAFHREYSHLFYETNGFERVGITFFMNL